MAALPPCSLCRVPNIVRNAMESNKKPILIYSIFFVLMIEWFSIFYLKFTEPTKNLVYDAYAMKVYPMLSQLALFVLFFSIFLWKERLHFCFRKSATTFYLSMYYLFGVFAVAFCFSANFYYEIISYGMIGIATLIFFVSFFKSEE